MSREGIDDSSWQHPNGAAVDYPAAVAGQIVWAAVKVTEGGLGPDGQALYVNPFAATDVTGFRAAGAETAIYHFARPAAGPPEGDAHAFAAAFAMLGAHGTVATKWLDLEDGLEQLGPQALATWVRAFIVIATPDGIYVDHSYEDALIAEGFPWGLKTWLARPGFDPAGEAPTFTDANGVEHSIAVVQYAQLATPGFPDGELVDRDVVYYEAPVLPEPPPVFVPPQGTPDPVPPAQVLDLTTLEVLSEGHTGTPVRRVQALLVAAGHTIAIDGAFGPITGGAVRTFQSAAQLEVDGVVGPNTWRRLVTG